jgi:hypothetical protein
MAGLHFYHKGAFPTHILMEVRHEEACPMAFQRFPAVGGSSCGLSAGRNSFSYPAPFADSCYADTDSYAHSYSFTPFAYSETGSDYQQQGR